MNEDSVQMIKSKLRPPIILKNYMRFIILRILNCLKVVDLNSKCIEFQKDNIKNKKKFCPFFLSNLERFEQKEREGKSNNSLKFKFSYNNEALRISEQQKTVEVLTNRKFGKDE